MLGREDYDLNWAKKMDIYDRYFPNQMVKTYESGAIATDAVKLIERIKNDSIGVEEE